MHANKYEIILQDEENGFEVRKAEADSVATFIHDAVIERDTDWETVTDENGPYERRRIEIRGNGSNSTFDLVLFRRKYAD